MIDRTRCFIGHYCLTKAALPERFAAAAAAGFAGISLYLPEVLTFVGGPNRLRRMLADLNLSAPQLEIVRLPGAADLAAFELVAKEGAETAASLGCQIVHAVALDKTASKDTVQQGFGMLAEACEKAGLNCAIEFVPFLSAVPDLSSAIGLVRAINARNAGIVIDSLHFFRCGAPWQDLATLQPGEIKSVQVNDGPPTRPTEDYRIEAMELRRLPGDGEFDLLRFLRQLDATATPLTVTAEVMSLTLDRQTAQAAAQRIADTTRTLLSRI